MDCVLIITGPPRTGKTTLVERLVAEFGAKAKGFVTREIRREGKRWGFEIIPHHGQRALLASVSLSEGSQIGKYRVNLKGIEETILEFFRDPGPASFYYVDEVGKMEMAHPEFKSTFVNFVTISNGVLLVTAGMGQVGWVKQVYPKAEVIDLGELGFQKGYDRARTWILDKIKA